jgi:hypothetical protein
MQQAFIFKADGSIEPIKPAHESGFTLEEVQALVHGYIEIVRLRRPLELNFDSEKEWAKDLDVTIQHPIIICNEEGKLMELPFNILGTHLYQYGMEYQTADFIVGDVIICESSMLK